MHLNRKIVTTVLIIVGLLAIISSKTVSHASNDESNGYVFKVLLLFADNTILDKDDIHFIYIKSTEASISQEQHELQSAMNQVLSNERNQNIKVLVSVKESENSQELVYDLVNITGEVSSADVFRVLLQFSEQVQEKPFDLIRLCYKGKEKFLLKGQYFQKIGKEYSFQNPVYTARTFTENVFNIDGSRAYPTWTGGMIGVVRKQMEDFNDFNRKWYVYDWINTSNLGEGVTNPSEK